MDVMRNDDQATQANLASWCDLTDLKHVGLKVKVEEEVRHVHTVASYDKMADDDVDALEVSVAAVRGIANKIAHVMEALPSGRKLVEVVVQYIACVKVAQKAARCAGAIVEGLDVIFVGDSFDWDKLVPTWNFCDAKLDAEIADKLDMLDKVQLVVVVVVVVVP